MRYRLGIDLGGTNIAAGLVNERMEIADRLSCKTKLPRSAKEIAEDIANLCHQLISRNHLELAQVDGIGIGVPGSANQETGCVEYANNLGFEHVSLTELVGAQIALPIAMDNDANAAAWGEYKAGAYEENSFIMLTLGTGIGAGMILNGKILQGVNYAAGEIGHMTIHFQGKPCNCGRRGCFEAYGSATALTEQAREALLEDKAGANRYASSALWRLCGGDTANMEAKLVFDAVKEGDVLAKSLLDTYTTYLAEGIANVINIFQPAVLCIGGGVSKAGRLLIDPIRQKTAQMIYSRTSKVNTRIILARFDNDAGIIGAALLADFLNRD